MSQWVKCSDRLPEDRKLVIVWVSRFGYYPDYMDCSSRQEGQWLRHNSNHQSITHWHPMPAAPTEGEA